MTASSTPTVGPPGGAGTPANEAGPGGVAPASRRMLGAEVWIVLLLSLLMSGLRAVLSLIESATAPQRLTSQSAVLVGSAAPGRPWIDLAWQLLGLVSALVPVALVLHLLLRGGESRRAIGFDFRRWRGDSAKALGLAALIGGGGLVVYLVAYAIGVSLTLVPSTLPDVWWREPVLVLYAVQNGVLEEVIVLGYLLHRLDQLGWGRWRAIGTSAVLRGSYHLYQGLGGFAGNLVMGLIFGWAYRRWGRCMPMVIAHSVIDTVAFVGYTLLVGKVGWLPAPH